MQHDSLQSDDKLEEAKILYDKPIPVPLLPLKMPHQQPSLNLVLCC